MPDLTPREREVFLLVAEGKTSREVGERLGISKRTSEFHVANIFEKLGVKNRVQAVRAALRSGLLTTEGSEESHAA